ncbi:MAG: hypothetical protein KVP17_001686 [Porospora cf. gigantea B]|uniref:uncharacterized protein n=1 Tax=Porospora cf. gigantea B TaxID=2853592 RepID=UPI003571E673|nr:MAG: hypothetical protein KVP17_001686 [Porospora cf. gigantea B]
MPTPLTVRSYLSPVQVYNAATESARGKIMEPWWRHLSASVLGGFWVFLWGHGCTVGAGRFFDYGTANETDSYAVATIIYGIVFPTCFAAITFSGADLFTACCMSGMVYAASGPKDWRHYVAVLRLWAQAFAGNLVGIVVLCGLVGHLGGEYRDHSGRGWQYLCHLAKGKVGEDFIESFVNAIACNMCVCLASWTLYMSHDVAGKFFGIIFPVLVFCIGGYQHVVANLFTLTQALMEDCGISYSEVFGNICPVLLGNIAGGCFIFAGMTVVILYPGTDDYGADYEWFRTNRNKTKSRSMENIPDLEKHGSSASLSSISQSQQSL